MTKNIKLCKSETDRLIENNSPDTDWEKVAERLLVQIKFFQHERLVHLIVTMTMCLLTVITICAIIISNMITGLTLALFVLFLSLTIAYLAHYYKLENGVQGLYVLYAELRKKTVENPTK